MVEPVPPGRSHGSALVDAVSRYSMVGVLVVLVAVAQVAVPGFLDVGNLEVVLVNTTSVGLVAIGMTFVLIGGGFDLSVGGIFAVAGVLFATLANSMPVGLAFALMVPIALAGGLANGLIITRLHVNPFVATLGSSSIFSGLAYLTNTTGAVTVERSGFDYLGTAKWWNVPVMIWILGVCFGIGAAVLARTVYGRSVYIVGGNADAARLSGMRVSRLQASTYALTALCAAIGGMLLASQTGVGQANVGVDVTLNSIAIVIIGGTSLRGGQGAMWRTFVGLLIIATVDSLFNSLAWDAATQSLAKGAIVIAAVALDSWSQRRTQSR
jgi:ribose transport system permease protein